MNEILSRPIEAILELTLADKVITVIRHSSTKDVTILESAVSKGLWLILLRKSTI